MFFCDLISLNLLYDELCNTNDINGIEFFVLMTVSLLKKHKHVKGQ